MLVTSQITTSRRRQPSIYIGYCTLLVVSLMLMFCLVLRLHGGNFYPQYILNRAGDPELNAEHQSIRNKFFGLYCMILHYWFPPTEGYDVCPKWTVPGLKKPMNPPQKLIQTPQKLVATLSQLLSHILTTHCCLSRSWLHWISIQT